MKKKLLSLLLVAAMGVSMLVGCGGTTGDSQDGDSQKPNSEVESGDKNDEKFEVNQTAIDNLIKNSEGKEIVIELWCSEKTEYQTIMKTVTDEFKALYPNVNLTINIGVCSESQAKDNVLADVEAAADVFVYADDQIAELVAAGALQEVVMNYTYDIEAANAASTVEAAKVNGKLYGYPLMASNGYFLYYNSEYLTEEDVQSWDAICAKAEAAGKKVGMCVKNSWYTYGFFAGAGGTLTMNADQSNSCDWNNATGVKVAEAMQTLFQKAAFTSYDSEALAVEAAKNGDCIAFVDGAWDSNAVKEAYGDHYAAAKLPTYTMDGKQVQMGSFAGYKFVGVNAFADSDVKGWAMLLAEYITNEASQSKIATAVGEGPSNLVAASSDAVKNNPALAALAAQAAYADLQRVGGKYWDPVNTLCANLLEGTVTDFQKAMDECVTGITQPAQ